MSHKSIYEYYRPMMVLSHLLGNFPVLKVTSKFADELVVRRISLPVIISLGVQASVCCSFIIYLMAHKLTLAVKVNSICELLFSSCYVMWLTYSFENVVKSFQATDRLKQTVTHLPFNLRPKVTSIEKFSKLMLAVFITTIFLAVFFTFQWKETCFANILLILNAVLVQSVQYRHLLIVSCIFYSCSLVVYDSIQAWHNYCWFNCRPLSHLHDFCQLVFDQKQILKDINELLQSYVLVYFAWAVYDLYMGSPFYILVDNPITSMATFVGCRVIYLGILVYCMNLSNLQIERFSQEVIDMAVRDMSWNECSKVRIFLDQLDVNPGMFSAHGFFKFALLGIECCILFVQNQSVLRELAGLPNTDVMPQRNFTEQ